MNVKLALAPLSLILVLSGCDGRKPPEPSARTAGPVVRELPPEERMNDRWPPAARKAYLEARERDKLRKYAPGYEEHAPPGEPVRLAKGDYSKSLGLPAKSRTGQPLRLAVPSEPTDPSKAPGSN